MAKATLPSYSTAAQVLEGHNGAGLRLVGWTVARTLMIAPPMMVVGVPTKQAFIGAMLASALMSTFVVLRIFDARSTGLAGVNRRRVPARRAIASRARR
jgi:hypothetical protein